MNPKYPSIQEMIQKLQEAGRTPIVPAPNRWFADPVKHPFQQKMIERVLAQTGQGREGFPSGSYINPQTGEPMDFDIMHDLGVAIDPNTGRPMMSGIKSDLTEIDPKYGSITKSNLVRKGLFKHEGGDELLKNLAFLATIEKSGKGHHYGLSTHYASPAELVNTMTGQNPTLRPHSRGDIFGVGDEVGRISIQGKHHPVYEKLLVAPAGSDVQGKKLHKDKGGVAHMAEGGSFVDSLVDTFPSLAPLASAFGYEKPTEAPAYNPLSAFPADTLPSSMPETVKFYRADPTGKFGGKEGLETLPTKFSAGKVDDPSTLYRYARMAGAANKYGYPTMSPEEVAAFAIKEGRADLGHNDMTLGNKQEKDFDKKLDTLHDIPIHDKNFLTALMAKKSTADRFGVSLPEAWNGLGVNSAGQSGRDYARNWEAQKAAALHPKNKEFMNFVRNAYEEGRKHGLIPNKNTQASTGQAPYKQGGLAHMADGGQYQSVMEDYNQPPRLPTAEEEAIEPVYPEEYLIGSGLGKSAINVARGLGNKVLSRAEMALRPAVKNDVVVSKGIGTKDFPIRMPNSNEDITHAYRNMSQAEYDAAKKSGYFEANPYAKYEEGTKWWSGGDELGKFGREWKGGKDAITVRVPRNKVPENKAVRFKDVEQMKHGGVAHMADGGSVEDYEQPETDSAPASLPVSNYEKMQLFTWMQKNHPELMALNNNEPAAFLADLALKSGKGYSDKNPVEQPWERKRVNPFTDQQDFHDLPTEDIYGQRREMPKHEHSKLPNMPKGMDYRRNIQELQDSINSREGKLGMPYSGGYYARGGKVTHAHHLEIEERPL